MSLMQLPRQEYRIMEKQLLNHPWNLDFKPEKSNTVKKGTKTQKKKMDVILHLNDKKCNVPERTGH